MRGPAPIADDELPALFACLTGTGSQPVRRLALAVSGGADSSALLHLAHRWAAASLAAPVVLSVVTVDHKLRSGSTGEALEVGARCRALGLAHAILTWDGPKPAEGIQAAARQARLALFRRHLAAAGIDAVATAHTEDDQAETLVMRLARGSGLDGLAGMTMDARVEGVRLLRPLLAVSRARLVATLRAAGLGWIEDPSNADPRFERVRIRAAQPHLEAIGLRAGPLATSARRLARARQALDRMTRRVLADPEIVGLDPLGLARVSWRRLAREPDEVRVRLLDRVLRAVGGSAGPLSMHKLETLAAEQDPDRLAGRTLGRVKLEPAGDGWLVALREAGRGGLPSLVLAPGETAIWDGRFRVALAAAAPCPVTVTTVGDHQLREIRAEGRPLPPAPRAALLAAPAFFAEIGGRLIAAPLFGASEDGGLCRAHWLGLQLACEAEPPLADGQPEGG